MDPIDDQLQVLDVGFFGEFPLLEDVDPVPGLPGLLLPSLDHLLDLDAQDDAVDFGGLAYLRSCVTHTLRKYFLYMGVIGQETSEHQPTRVLHFFF